MRSKEIVMKPRRVMVAAGTALLAFSSTGGTIVAARRTTSGMSQPSLDQSIRPFKFQASADSLADLRRRVSATKWPERETVADTTQGVQLETMQKLARYWATDYNWRKAEAKLNAFPQFITTI